MSNLKFKKNVNKLTAANATAAKKNANKTDGFDIITNEERLKIQRREREFRAMQAKLTKINSERKVLALGLREKNPTGHGKALSNKEFQNMMSAYLETIINPFDVQGVKYPSPFDLPTVTFTTKTNREFELGTNITGNTDTLVVIAPLRFNKEFAATGNSTTALGSSTIVGSYKCPVASPIQRYTWNGVGWATANYPIDDNPTLGWVSASSGTPNIWAVWQYAINDKIASITSLYSHTRLVSAGLRIRYDGAPVDAKGKIAVALLPPGQDVLLYRDGATVGDAAIAEPNNDTFQPTWENVTALPGCQIFGVVETMSKPISVSLRPFSSAVEDWCPTKPRVASAPCLGGSGCTGVEGGPPITTDPQTNVAVNITSAAISQAFEALGGGVNWQDANAYYGFTAMQEMMQGPSTCWPSIIVIYKGTDTTAKLNVEMVSNYEAIIESRELMLGSFAASAQGGLAEREHARLLARHIPPANTDSSWSKVVAAAGNVGGRLAKTVLNNVGGVKNALAWLGAETGIELPAVFGDIAEAGLVAAAFL